MIFLPPKGGFFIFIFIFKEKYLNEKLSNSIFKKKQPDNFSNNSKQIS